MNSLSDKVWEKVRSQIYINIATCVDNQPWNTPVYAVCDSHLNFFWRSWIHSQHSQNLRVNDAVFLTIYDSNRPLGTNHQQCVYIQGRAMELSHPKEVENALTFFPDKNHSVDEFLGDSIKRVYQARPEKVWLNDKSESQVTPNTASMRIEVPLDQLLHDKN